MNPNNDRGRNDDTRPHETDASTPRIATDGGTATRSTSADRPTASAVDLTLFQHELLYALAKTGASNGLGIKDELAERYDDEINNGRLYPNLDQLVNYGLVDKRRNQHDDRSNEYALTDAGKRLIQDDAERRQTIAYHLDARNDQ